MKNFLFALLFSVLALPAQNTVTVTTGSSGVTFTLSDLYGSNSVTIPANTTVFTQTFPNPFAFNIGPGYITSLNTGVSGTNPGTFSSSITATIGSFFNIPYLFSPVIIPTQILSNEIVISSGIQNNVVTYSLVGDFKVSITNSFSFVGTTKIDSSLDQYLITNNSYSNMYTILPSGDVAILDGNNLFDTNSLPSTSSSISVYEDYVSWSSNVQRDYVFSFSVADTTTSTPSIPASAPLPNITYRTTNTNAINPNPNNNSFTSINQVSFNETNCDYLKAYVNFPLGLTNGIADVILEVERNVNLSPYLFKIMLFGTQLYPTPIALTPGCSLIVDPNITSLIWSGPTLTIPTVPLYSGIYVQNLLLPLNLNPLDSTSSNVCLLY